MPCNCHLDRCWPLGQMYQFRKNGISLNMRPLRPSSSACKWLIDFEICALSVWNFVALSLLVRDCSRFDICLRWKLLQHCQGRAAALETNLQISSAIPLCYEYKEWVALSIDHVVAKYYRRPSPTWTLQLAGAQLGHLENSHQHIQTCLQRQIAIDDSFHFLRHWWYSYAWAQLGNILKSSTICPPFLLQLINASRICCAPLSHTV